MTSAVGSMKIEPIYQLKIHGDSWIDQAKHSYEYNVKHGPAVVRAVYTEAQLRQLGEACAALVETQHSTKDEQTYGLIAGELIRNLIKEMLP